jgi:hypothetical protein
VSELSNDLLRRAAAAMRDEAHREAALREDDPYWQSGEASTFEKRWRPAVALAAADLLVAADEARPIDFTAPPRSPADRRVIYAALTFAQHYLAKQTGDDARTTHATHDR